MDNKPDDNQSQVNNSPVSPVSSGNTPPLPVTPPETASPVAASTEAATSEVSSPSVPDQTAGSSGSGSFPASGPSTVVVPGRKSRLPVWFYILFGIVLVIFLTVTFLLVRTVLERRSSSVTGPQTDISLSPQVQKDLVPTVIPTPVDEYLESLNSVSDSDETADIEADLDSTDSSVLQKDFEALDSQLGG